MTMNEARLVQARVTPQKGLIALSQNGIWSTKIEGLASSSTHSDFLKAKLLHT